MKLWQAICSKTPEAEVQFITKIMSNLSLSILIS